MTSAFIHIPKTGGRSILRALGKPWSSAHKTLADLIKEDQSVCSSGVLKFTCVRNPWDRAVSMWLFFGHMVIPSEVSPFAEWLLKRAKLVKRNPNQRPRMDQMDFCCDDKGEIRIDHFLKFESLASDFAKIADRLGSPKDLPHIGRMERFDAGFRLSSSQKREREILANDYRDAYKSQDLIDAVAILDGRTIKKFGYSFGDPQSSMSEKEQAIDSGTIFSAQHE